MRLGRQVYEALHQRLHTWCSQVQGEPQKALVARVCPQRASWERHIYLKQGWRNLGVTQVEITSKRHDQREKYEKVGTWKQDRHEWIILASCSEHYATHRSCLPAEENQFKYVFEVRILGKKGRCWVVRGRLLTNAVTHGPNPRCIRRRRRFFKSVNLGETANWSVNKLS